MIDNPLLLKGANAVIAGGGAIGTAFANQLSARSEAGQVVVLARRAPQGLDARVQVVPLEATDPASVAAAAEACSGLGRVHLLINTVGLLHASGVKPEKRLKDIQAEAFQQAMAVNALFLTLLAEAFSRALRHGQAAMLASLSARVGSIADNGLGGWYSYRASKAAQNMLLRTLSREWRVSHRNVTVVALHPGTVDSALSRPYIGPAYGKRVLSPDEAASHLLQVMRGLSPADSGSFFDWQGEPVPW
jgi:NAD(P)-dependent dehydrogenase (short-subunit alcohol dehydrogenase family)